MVESHHTFAVWVVLGLVAGGAACSRNEGPPRSDAAAPPSAAAPPLPVPGDLPAGPGAPAIPAQNPQTPAKIALGRRLFFEPRLSADGKLSCYSCHRNEDGNGGHDATAVGDSGVKIGIHAPALWNVAYLPVLYWNGRARSLEEQATLAWSGPNLGVGQEHLAAKARELGALPDYRADFAAVFPDRGATPETVVQALAAFERTLVCTNTAYDRFARGDAQALSLAQQRGLGVFVGKGVCSACHTPPLFSAAYTVPEGVFFNVGIGFAGKDPSAVEPGRRAISGRDEDFGAVKPPTLRNVARSAPYFHDGSVPTLEEAIRYMASGGTPNAHLSPLLQDRKLSDTEVADVVAFLGALDCGTIEPPPGYADQGNKGKLP